ncbi:phosphatase PAP2 family protein [Vibrio sp. ZSDE26]|uniref:Phosphatase PAP2 family protein n=1 Tax=Vibrio amylolyticus TaxID=2847292 RepID=A0A9X1XI15_9VIBR|nr:phosphatase PAP2 family protein [Vibrio amylolyticus]MCK6262470.1 phosphatase PAP2 family protein [Vibrio amylolyticus]
MDSTPKRKGYVTQWKSIKVTLLEDKFIYVYALLSSVGIYLVLHLMNVQLSYQYNAFSYLKSLASMCYISFFTWSAYYYGYMLYHRVPSPLTHYGRKVLSFFNPLSKAISFALLMLTLNITISSYSYLKSLIPDLHPFEYDLLFYQLDKWLHFGTSPWEWTHAVFSNQYATFIINFIYHLWFFFMWGSLLYFIIDRREKLIRNQYLLSFLLSWLLIGGISATILSSAGPCYMHLLNPEHNDFLPLLDILTTQSRQLMEIGFPPLWALDVQDMLWLKYLNRDGGIGIGISAMPSMHVSIAVLMAMGSYRKNKTLGCFMWANALLIQIGSVHLAWHYAIDGYVSAIMTVIMWKIVGASLTKLT